MFRGQYSHTIDTKGRVSIPTAYRKQLQSKDRAPILSAAGNCLRLYPADNWSDYEERIVAQADVDPTARDYVRLVIANSTDVPLDKQGRILVPQFLREHAGLQREVTFAGVGRTVEIWDAARFVTHLNETQANFHGISEQMAGKLGS